MKKQKPAWLKDPVQENGEKFVNDRFESIYLNPIEATIYKLYKKCLKTTTLDYVRIKIGLKKAGDALDNLSMEKDCEDWFKTNSPEAYNILIEEK